MSVKGTIESGAVTPWFTASSNSKRECLVGAPGASIMRDIGLSQSMYPVDTRHESLRSSVKCPQTWKVPG